MIGRPGRGATEGAVSMSENVYAPWIAQYLARHDHKVLGRCKEAVAAMRAAFPELVEVRGHAHTPWGKRGHVWCVTPSGEIVDPTAEQFPAIFAYEPWKPGDAVDVGACMNCGERIWRAVQSLDVAPERPSSCSPACSEALHEYYNRALRPLDI